MNNIPLRSFVDIVVFDPAKIADRAAFERPHQYAVGMKQVFVNGVQVLQDGGAHRRKAGPRPVGTRQAVAASLSEVF